ncbi:hypothetical protein PsorP6_014956 [Peronosclerospora sorghi]|uniref:Uncharacterized protein n=1 Tax=Peronosclerospora sorghi TaxID=230839 RepID=A0ACC0VT17_9STRA|nr:hypothetical protein PsorP6_014956 [Peronosclerospora sorghi]
MTSAKEFAGYHAIALPLPHSSFRRFIYARKHATKSSSTRESVLADGRTAYVVNLPTSASEEWLRACLEPIGAIQHVHRGGGTEKQCDKSKDGELSNGTAHVVFKTEESLDKLLQVDTLAPPSPEKLSGLQAYEAKYRRNRPGLSVLKEMADRYMSLFDKMEEDDLRRREELKHQVDEDGFQMVVNTKKRGITEAEDVLARPATKQKSKGLDNFYRFQTREKKRDQLKTLRERFQEDRKLVEKMKMANKPSLCSIMEDRTLSFHTTTAMCWAASVGNMDAIRRLRNEHGVDVNAADYDKRTPLHVAVSDGQVAIVTYLLACGANPNALDRWGRSPMDYAIETKNAAIQEMVASPRYRTFPARSHSKAHVEMFFRAVEEGDTEQVKRSWLRGLEVNVTDEVGRTALHVAVEKGQVDVIELLLSAGVAINVVDANGRSPISIAHETQQVVILDMLRTHQKKILGKDQSKRTSHEDEQRNVLAYQAIKQGNLETFKQLVPEKVCPDTEDYDQRTLLHVASAENQFEIAKYLVECGANVNRLDRWGSSPLSDAIYFAHNELATFLMANHASESGFQTTVATDLLDSATLTRALEFILRVITRVRHCMKRKHATHVLMDPWLIGQVHCPVLDGDKKCVLVTHNLWHKSNTLMGKQESRDEVGPVNTATVLTDVIQTYRKVSSVVMIDPGQGHIGTVFTGQHPEWLDLDSTQQSHFFLLPHARRAGFRTVVSVPVISKMSTIAVLSWSSVRTVAEDPHELQRMQRVVRSVMILATLRQEVQSAASSTTDARRMSRFLYCQTLDSAITANGELLDAATRRQDVDGGDTLSFALEWGLFDLVDSLATSMSSEDHAAVIPLLRSLVQLLYNGLFDDALRQWSGMETRRQMKTFSLKSLVEACGGKVRTKWALLGHLKYYLQYLYAVSPTEAEVFADVQDLSNRVETFLKKQGAREERAADAVEKSAGSVHKDEKETEKSPDPAPSSTTLSSVSECVLCKYNVPGKNKHT